MTTFIDRLDDAARANRSLLCVGLDPWRPSMPIDDIAAFNRAIIDATADLVCAFKPNFAFYEAEGLDGLRALQATIEAVPGGVPVILDAKRGDLGNTAAAYARAAFEGWGAHAVTVNPYQGRDSLQPFLDYADRGVFVLARTSNPGAAELQDLPIPLPPQERAASDPLPPRGRAGERAASDPLPPRGRAGERAIPLYEHVVRRAVDWNDNGNVGLVVGATAPDELARARSIAGSIPILVPGIGAQGGDLEASVRNGVDARGRRAVISASRSVLYASGGRDFADAARAEALRLRNAINDELDRMGKGWT